jgi:hypothetical protein
MIPFSSLSLDLSLFNFLKQKHHYLSKNCALPYFAQIEPKKVSSDDFFMTTLEQENERKKA